MNPFQRCRNTNSLQCPLRTLVIVDMQDEFVDYEWNYDENEIPIDYTEIVPGICSLVQYAIKNCWSIIFVEFDPYGTTIEILSELVADYQHFMAVQKYGQDGGPQVIECLQEHPQWSRHLLVCGLYGDACVPSTVQGLLRDNILTEVDVITDLVLPRYQPRCLPNRKQEREIVISQLGTEIGVAV